MKMKYPILVLLVLVTAISSCKDDELKRRVDELESQVHALESVPEPQLSLAFNYAEKSFLKKGETIHIGFTITSNLTPVQVEAIPGNGLSVILTRNGTTGDIAVTLNALGNDPSTQMVVIASNGKKVEMKKFIFTEGGIEATDNLLKNVPKDGGMVALEFLTNESFDLIIEDNATSWISAAQTKAMAKNTLMLSVEGSQGISRSARVILKGQMTGTELVYTISQDFGYSYGIAVEHHARSISAPTIISRAEDGSISWGDGKEEALTQGARHTYTDDEESHCMTVCFPEISGFSIDSMEGISMIDLSALLKEN